MARYSSLRASDADRDAVAEQLREAAVEGRLEPEELEERLHLALRARTYGDLRRLVGDLPAKRARVPATRTAFVLAVRVAAVLVAVAVILAFVALRAIWLVLWALVFMALRARRYGAATSRSNARRTSIGSFTIPNSRSHAAHFCRTSWRSWP